MKVILYWMEGCPHCEKIKKELKNVPGADNIVQIEKKHINASAKSRYGISVYPTLVFLAGNDKMINKLEGFATADEIALKKKGCERLDKLHERTGKLH